VNGHTRRRGCTIFHEQWWLDTVAPGRWARATVEGPAGVQAALPYVVKTALGTTRLTMPPLTQFLGPCFSEGAGKYPNQLGQWHGLCDRLIDALPTFDYFAQPFAPAVTDFLPFHWRGFSQTTRYTYVLGDLSDLDTVRANMLDNIRRAVKKGGRTLDVADDAPASVLTDVVRAGFGGRGRSVPYSTEVLERLVFELRHRGRGQLLTASDKGQVHAALLFCWDDRSGYYVAGGAVPALRTSGATPLLMWEAVRRTAALANAFDFEGSMIPAVERVVRGFGGRQVPYSYITKANLKARSALFAASTMRAAKARAASELITSRAFGRARRISGFGS
jgi:hypothetical protein